MPLVVGANSETRCSFLSVYFALLYSLSSVHLQRRPFFAIQTTTAMLSEEGKDAYKRLLLYYHALFRVSTSTKRSGQVSHAKRFEDKNTDSAKIIESTDGRWLLLVGVVRRFPTLSPKFRYMGKNEMEDGVMWSSGVLFVVRIAVPAFTLFRPTSN